MHATKKVPAYLLRIRTQQNIGIILHSSFDFWSFLILDIRYLLTQDKLTQRFYLKSVLLILTTIS